MNTLFRMMVLVALGWALLPSQVSAQEDDDPGQPSSGRKVPTVRPSTFAPTTGLPGPKGLPAAARKRFQAGQAGETDGETPAVKRRRSLVGDESELGGDTKAVPGRKLPPGSKSTKALPGEEGATGDDKTPRWQQVEAPSEPAEPTLSADFIKNCAQLKPGMKVHLDIYDEELEAVVKLMACLTGRNIVLAKPLKGKKITIYSPTKVSSREAYRVFLTALEANGLTISKQGNFLRIIDAKDAPRNPDPLLPESADLPNEDRMVTQIISLKHVDAQEINEVLSRLATANAQFIVYQPTNSLIVTELSSNLRKLKQIIAQLDVAGGQDQLWTYQVLHADAAEIAQKITEVFEAQDGRKSSAAAAGPAKVAPRKSKAGAQEGTPAATTSASVGESEMDVRVTKVLADERTNRLLIITTARSYRQVKSLIQKLDVEIPGDGQIHIHQLNHAKATDLASVLSNLSQEQRSRSNQAGGRAGKAPVASSANTPAKSASASKAGGASAALFEGEVSVTADEDTNALVITASLKDYLSLKKVIDVLDRPRRQVFIEAVVMEVSLRNKREFGLSMHGATEVGMGGEKIPFILSNQPGSTKSFDLTSAATLTGLAAALQGSPSGVEIGGTDVPSFGVIMRAMATSTDVNILSTPHILTTDTEEAEIVVGSNVPFVSSVSGSGYGAATTGLSSFFPTVNVQRQDVALTLKITPRINAANSVTLEIDQVIEEIEGIDQQLGPTTSKRSIKSTVKVRDQNTVVIGGLQKTRTLNGKSAVPFLGEIPVIGYFFRDTQKDVERRNLLLLLTPYVIESPADFQAIFTRKMEEHREFVARFHQDGDQLSLGVDYGKKHGLLESIHKSIAAARDEEALIEELRQQDQGPPLPQDIDGVPVDEVQAEPEATPAAEIAPAAAEDAPETPSIPVVPVAPKPEANGDELEPEGDIP